MQRVRPHTAKSQPRVPTPTPPARQLTIPPDGGTVQLALVQALIPLGLKAVEEMLTAEVTALAGARYVHEPTGSRVVRWGQQGGSIYLADQKVPIDVPRVRVRRSPSSPIAPAE